MRILIDCRILYETRRGIGYYLEHLLHGLAAVDARNQYTLGYVSRRTQAEGILRLPYPNFRTRVWRYPNGLFSRLFRDSSLPYRLARGLSRGYDLVHEPAFSPLPLAPRSVVTVHDMSSFRLASFFARAGSPADFQAIYLRRIRESARNAAQVITDSEHARREAIEILGLPPEKVHAVLLGVDPAAFGSAVPEDEARRELAALGVTRPFLLSLGGMDYRKNNAVLVQAFARLPKELRPECQLVIAGPPGEASEGLARDIAARGLEGSVLLRGYVAESARNVLLSRATALCYPSLYEGFGLPVLEAMAAGVPTASSDNSSLPEVVGDAGLLVADYAEPDAWAAALTRLLTDAALRARLTESGLARARLFTWENTARETLAVYRLAAETSPCVS